MNRKTVQWWVQCIAVFACVSGCSSTPDTPSLPSTDMQREMVEIPQYVSFAIAVDLSSSGKTYHVPAFNAKEDLQPVIDFVIENGGGSVAVINISRFSDIPPAIMVLEPGHLPEAPYEPVLSDFDNQQKYYLARNQYEQEILPAYQKKQAEYDRYCKQLLHQFWEDVHTVLTERVDTSASDYHSALNRLLIAHQSVPFPCEVYATVVMGDGYHFIPGSVALKQDTILPIQYYWAYGTANPAMAHTKVWIQSLEPTVISNLNAVYSTILKP